MGKGSEPKYANNFYSMRLNAFIDAIEYMDSLSDHELADALGVDRKHFKSMRNYTRPFTVDVFFSLNEMTGARTDWLLGGR